MNLTIQTNKDNPILRQKSQEVKEITAEIKQLVLDMVETIETKKGLGLAAPQVGQSLRLIVFKSGPTDSAIALVNPLIIKISKKQTLMTEGCLSLPNISLPIKRAEKIAVEGLSPKGQKVKIKAKGLLARVIQHEIDHLDGILIVDKND